MDPRDRSNRHEALPPPDAGAAELSERLTAVIRTEIDAHDGAISFARYMELALYAPGLGYYSAGHRKFGAAGDFVTAPELSPLFARCLSRQCAQVLAAMGGGSVLEVGAGSGALAGELLATLASDAAPLERYLILEVSADLRERQQRAISQRNEALRCSAEWLDRLPDRFRGVLIANELIDALPVHRLVRRHGVVREMCVTWTENRFDWCLGEPRDDRLAARVEQAASVSGDHDEYIFEINLAAEDWLRSVADILDEGVILLIDYGYPQREYFHPQRHGGTVMCHYRHRAHTDPLILPGLQDITAHVNFTALAETAHVAGLEVAGFSSQSYFLLSCGLLEIAETDAVLEATGQVRLAQEVKRLTLPGEMGERFKVLALGRGLASPLLGFTLRDDRIRL